jgi:type I restriction enzyme R subunit
MKLKKHLNPSTSPLVLSEETDANKLNDLQDALDKAQVYTSEDDVHKFTDLYFKHADRQSLDPIIDACVENFKSEN